MNREIFCKSKYGISYRQRMGESQSFLLAGTGQRGLAAGGAFSQTATGQRPLLLQALSMTMNAGNTGMVTSLKVAGQETFVSNQGAPVAAFSSQSGGASASQRVMGIATNNNQTVSVAGTVTGAGSISYSISALPLSSQQVSSTANQAQAYNYVCGLGEIAIAAGPAALATLTCTVLRSATLGEVVLCNNATAAPFAASEDIYLESFLVNGLEQLAGADGQAIALTNLIDSQSDTNGFRLGVHVEANSIIQLKFRSESANAGVIAGAIFIEPWKK